MTSFFSRKTMLLFLLFPFAGPAQSSPPQAQNETSQNVVKANTRQVVVDVVATDGKGAPITDLEAQDFTVLENGKAQKISDFSFQHPQAAAEAATPSLPPNVFTNVPVRKSSSLNVLLLDGLNGEFASRAQALDQLNKYLGSSPEIQPTAIYVLNQKLKLLQGFTTDARVLKQVLAGFKPQATQMDTVGAAASAFTQRGSFQTSPQTIETTLQALDVLARSLAGYPGRKNLIWLSEAFPVNLFPDIAKNGQTGAADSMTVVQFSKNSPSDYAAQVAKVADAFMTAQVAVYPVDAAGVGRNSQVDSLTTMRTMADRTGGKTYANQNDLQAGLRGSIDDGSTYYTLAYYPEDKNWDGKFRQVEVKVDRPGTNLRYRQGYYALNPEAESEDKEGAKKLGAEFTEALGLESPSSTAILFRATVAPPSGAEKTTVSFAIDPHTLAYTDQESGKQANVGCAIVAYSGKGAMVGNQIHNVVGTVKVAEFSQFMQTSFPCQCALDLKPGRYTLRLGVVDKTSTMIGTATATVTVP
jgi:VWFA-related protein